MKMLLRAVVRRNPWCWLCHPESQSPCAPAQPEGASDCFMGDSQCSSESRFAMALNMIEQESAPGV